LQILSEKGLSGTKLGRAATGILLFQIILGLPAIATIPLISEANPITSSSSGNLWVAVIAIPLLLVAGRYLLRPFLRYIIASRDQALITGAALLIVIAASLLMQAIGMSPSIGAFFAGVLLAESEYRYEMEARIAPFKDLLVGLFFLAVGMQVDLTSLIYNPARNALLLLALILLKGIPAFVLARASNLDWRSSLMLSLLISSGGEFAFVLMAMLVQFGIVPILVSEQLILTVTLSILVTPVIYATAERMLRKYDVDAEPHESLGFTRPIRAFISYSRQDVDSAATLTNRLERSGVDVIIDASDLPYGEEWQAHLDYLISQADAVVFMVSAASIDSRWCQWELNRVKVHQKRLVPIMIEAIPLEQLPKSVVAIQLMPQSGTFNVSDKEQVRALVEALQRNQSWLKEHTRLSERARFWVNDNRNEDWLLRGAELQAAEVWRDERPTAAPDPTPSVLDLIHSSQIFASKQ